jgi:hypothetical protein
MKVLPGRQKPRCTGVLLVFVPGSEQSKPLGHKLHASLGDAVWLAVVRVKKKLASQTHG